MGGRGASTGILSFSQVNRLKKALKKTEQYQELGIRGVSKDESIHRQTGLSWDDTTDDEPIEMDGVSATKVETADFIHGMVDMDDPTEVDNLVKDIEKALEYHKRNYAYKSTYLIVGEESDDFPMDEKEVVIKNHKVVFKF